MASSAAAPAAAPAHEADTSGNAAPQEPSQNVFSPGDKIPILPWPDIGHLARWSVSSYKFGFGPECLRDNDPETFWHSDGPQPHAIFVQFPRKTAIQKVSLHLNFQLDDSYTPSTLCLRAGTSLSDLQDVRVVTLEKPNGWITFDVSAEFNEDGTEFKPVYCYVLQIIILANHMNGKDTHVRGLRILGPAEEASREDDPFPFVSHRFKVAFQFVVQKQEPSLCRWCEERQPTFYIPVTEKGYNMDL